MVAILPYTKMPDTDELSFKKGDIFFVHNDMGEGWLWVTAHRTGEQGMIFRELVEDLDASIDPNTVFSWFHPNCTKSEAVDMLVKGKRCLDKGLMCIYFVNYYLWSYSVITWY